MTFDVVSTYFNSCPKFSKDGIVFPSGHSKQTRQFPGHARRCQRRIPGQGTAAKVQRQTFWKGRYLKIFDHGIWEVSLEYRSKNVSVCCSWSFSIGYVRFRRDTCKRGSRKNMRRQLCPTTWLGQCAPLSDLGPLQRFHYEKVKSEGINLCGLMPDTSSWTWKMSPFDQPWNANLKHISYLHISLICSYLFNSYSATSRHVPRRASFGRLGILELLGVPGRGVREGFVHRRSMCWSDRWCDLSMYLRLVQLSFKPCQANHCQSLPVISDFG